MKRTLPILAVLTIVVLAGLWWLSRDRGQDLTLGGPLFPVDSDRIEGLLVTRQGLQFRFDRGEDGFWTLSGAIGDYLDQPSMAALVRMLPTATGGALLPGSVPEDRRYEFNGPDAIRLRVYLADGQDISLALGTINPVTGNYYASGAGRDGCFPVAAPLRDKLWMLPKTVQAKTLLPDFDPDLVQSIRLVRSGTTHEFAKVAGVWWLRLDDADRSTSLAGLPPLVQQYQALYTDRLRDAEGARWIMAAAQPVGQLIYEVSGIIVRDVLSPRQAAQRRTEWQLDPPWRQVELRGPGLNPDPSAPDADTFSLVFGPPVAPDRVPVLRRDNVLLTDEVAINLLDLGLEVFVAQDALNATARHADGLVVTREGRRLLEAARTAAAETPEGRTAWRTTFPAAREGLAESDRHGFAQDLVVDLNRIPILAVLPPSDDPAVLAEAGRVRVTLSWQDGARELVFESGTLQPDHLPPGARPLARPADGEPPTGLWFPATGKLLQIPASLMVTARSMEPMVGAAQAE